MMVVNRCMMMMWIMVNRCMVMMWIMVNRCVMIVMSRCMVIMMNMSVVGRSVILYITVMVAVLSVLNRT